MTAADMGKVVVALRASHGDIFEGEAPTAAANAELLSVATSMIYSLVPGRPDDSEALTAAHNLACSKLACWLVHYRVIQITELSYNVGELSTTAKYARGAGLRLSGAMDILAPFKRQTVLCA